MKGLRLIPAAGEPIRVEKDPAAIGRDSSADVVLSHKSVSRKHAVLERTVQGWMVSDQKSANGTWIDGQRVIRAILRPGQSIRFGAVTFTVSLEFPERAPSAIGAMSVAEAAGILGVPPGTPAHEVREKYRKICDDLRGRLTNAPTAGLKSVYEEDLQNLRRAAEVISPGILEEG